jgi:hypothetical protein
LVWVNLYQSALIMSPLSFLENSVVFDPSWCGSIVSFILCSMENIFISMFTASGIESNFTGFTDSHIQVEFVQVQPEDVS